MCTHGWAVSCIFIFVSFNVFLIARDTFYFGVSCIVFDTAGSKDNIQTIVNCSRNNNLKK